MTWYPELLQNLVLPVAEKLLKTPYNSVVCEWRQLEKMEAATIGLIQQTNLRRLLTHAATTVPGYRPMPPNAGLKDFPIATKAMYRDNEDQWISNKFNKGKLLIEKSSGSSGIQGKVYMSKVESMRSLAHQTYLWSWAGYKPGVPLLQLGITTNRNVMKKIKDALFRTLYRPAFNLNQKLVKEDLDRVRQTPERNYIFGGYASGLYEYASIAKDLGINHIHFASVISWGDKMFEHYRSLIESQFHCKVFDTYGTTEGFVIAGQCAYGAYHLLSPHIHLELLDENDKEVAPGEWGHVVITRLDAFAMPLIRYRLGDLAVKEDPQKGCDCGRPFPMLKKIIGRDTDVVRTPSGNALIVHFFTGIFEHIEEIRQFQVVQLMSECFVLRYISELPDEKMQAVLEGAKQTMNKKAGEALNVKFERVEIISPSPSGKPQIIISRLGKGRP